MDSERMISPSSSTSSGGSIVAQNLPRVPEEVPALAPAPVPKSKSKNSLVRCVKANALEKMFAELREDQLRSGVLFHDFLATYVYFAKSTEVIKALENLYHNQEVEEPEEPKEQEQQEQGREAGNNTDVFSPDIAPRAVSCERLTGSRGIVDTSMTFKGRQQSQYMFGTDAFCMPLPGTTPGTGRRAVSLSLDFRPRVSQLVDRHPKPQRRQQSIGAGHSMSPSVFHRGSSPGMTMPEERALASRHSEPSERDMAFMRENRSLVRTLSMPCAVEDGEVESSFHSEFDEDNSRGLGSREFTRSDWMGDVIPRRGDHPAPAANVSVPNPDVLLLPREEFIPAQLHTSASIPIPRPTVARSTEDLRPPSSSKGRWPSLQALPRLRKALSGSSSALTDTEVPGCKLESSRTRGMDTCLSAESAPALSWHAYQSSRLWKKKEVTRQGSEPSVLSQVVGEIPSRHIRLRVSTSSDASTTEQSLVGALTGSPVCATRTRSATSSCFPTGNLSATKSDLGILSVGSAKSTGELHSPDFGKLRLQKAGSKICSAVTLRTFSILKLWVKSYPEDFQKNSETRKILTKFVSGVQAKGSSADASIAGNLLKTLKSREDASSHAAHKTFERKSSQPESLPLSTTSAYPHLYVAEQLTLGTHQAFFLIKPRELCKQAWKGKNRLEIAPNVCAMIDRCNRLGNWVPTEILSGRTALERAENIERIIRIAFHCLELHNLNDTIIIAYSLQNSAIERLTKSWKIVPTKVMKMLEDMKKVCSASERYQAMRTYIHARDPPCVPFIGAYLDMIYGIDVTMKTYDEAGFVNFSKMARLAHQIRELTTFQQEQYLKIKYDHQMHLYFEVCPILSDDDEIFALSLEREPRVTRLTSESFSSEAYC